MILISNLKEKVTDFDPNGNKTVMAKLTLSEQKKLPLAILDKSDDFVLRFWVKANNRTLSVYASETKLKDVRATSEWTEVIIKFQGTCGDLIYFLMPAGTYFIWHNKLENATIPSDYDKNQADTENYLSQELITLSSEINQRLDAIDLTVSKQVSQTDNLGTRMNSAESSIQIHAEKIQSKVETSDFNGEHIVSMVNQTADEVKIQAKKIELDGAVSFKTLDSRLQNTIDTAENWSDYEDLTLINGAMIKTKSIKSQQIDVDNLFAQNIKATGIIEGAKLKGASIEGRSQIVIFNPNNGDRRIGIYNESVNKHAQMNDYSGIIHINDKYAGWIVGGQLCLGKYTGSYTQGKISSLSIDFENGIILQGNTENPWGRIGDKDIIVSGDNRISSFQNKISYLEINTDTGQKGINWWNSDTRLKKNIEETDIDNALEVVDQFKHHKFDWKDESIKSVKLGYLAHELQELDEDLVFAVKQNEGSEYDELLQIDETHLIPYLSKAIQELHQIVRSQQIEIEILKEKVNYADNKDVN